MTQTGAGDAEAHSRDELDGSETGLWVVTTRSSKYHFDLDQGLVTRIRGLHANRTINDFTRPLKLIVRCAVGASGFWYMFPVGTEFPLFEDLWQCSTEIVTITRVDQFDSEE